MSNADLEQDPEDLANTSAESFIAPQIGELAPVTASTWACMEAARIGIIAGDNSKITYDCSAFCVLHSRDRELSDAAKSAAFNEAKFRSLVFAWLEENPGIHSQFSELTTEIAEKLNRYAQLMTRKIEKPTQPGATITSTKKNGSRNGSRRTARR